MSELILTCVGSCRNMRVLGACLDIASDQEHVAASADVAVLATTAVQRCARLALQGEHKEAYKMYLAYQQLLAGCSQCDTQQEEFQAFQQESSMLLHHLGLIAHSKTSRAHVSDRALQEIQKMKRMHVTKFLSGARKRNAVTARSQVNQQMVQQYYQYTFTS
eukprot:m.290479 g.290479  ORF g.290479 m.290479 type:complete len:162 (+) comp15816_c0_seq31:2640-3125(+)